MTRVSRIAKPYYNILIYLPLCVIRNKITSATLDKYFKNLILLTFGAGVASAEYVFFAKLWETADQIPMGFILLLPRFISLTCSFFFAFLSYSCLFTALSTLYHSEDLKILLCSPLSISGILIHKSIDIFIRSGSTLILLSLPAIVSLGVHLHCGMFYYIFTLIQIVAVSIWAAGIGICLAMALMAVFPAKRMHQTIAILGLGIAVFAITSLRFLHLESLWGEDALKNPLFTILGEESWLTKYSPGYLFAQAVFPLCAGDKSLSFWYWINLGISIFSIGGILLLGKGIFLKGWMRLQEKCDPDIRRSMYSTTNIWDKIPFSKPWASLMKKDAAIFVRDASVWTQVLMMVPLGVLYVLNILFLPTGQNELRNVFAITNLGMVGLIIAAVGARYLFPAASREGKPVWVLYSSPLGIKTKIFQKLLFAIPPVFLLGMTLLIVSCALLNIETTLFIKVISIGFFQVLQMCMMAVFLGFCFPVYSFQNVMEVSLGKGAFIFMLLAVLEIGSFLYMVWNSTIITGEITIPVWSTPFWLWGIAWIATTYTCFLLGWKRSRFPDE